MTRKANIIAAKKPKELHHNCTPYTYISAGTPSVSVEES